MRRAAVGLLLAGAALAEATETEGEILARYLAGPATQAALEAAAAASEADGALPPLLSNPELQIRQEEARGPAGAATQAVGGGMSLDLGMASVSARSAGRLRAEAAVHRRHAAVLTAMCDARQDILSLWMADEQATITARRTARLESVLSSLDALSMVGESAGYDRDRAALALTAHRLTAAEALGEQAAWQARLSAMTDAPVSRVQLASLPPLPALSASLSASEAHPMLASLRLEADAAGRDTAAARRAVVPDLHLSGGARWDAPPEGGEATQGYEIGAAVELPIFDLGRGERKSAAAEEAAAAAALEQARAEIQARVEGAWRRAEVLQALPASAGPDRIWEAARSRYVAGEADIDELLQVAADLGEAQLAATLTEHRYRSARLDLECAVGHFDAPELQAILEESIR